jgi:hypothetical protein
METYSLTTTLVILDVPPKVSFTLDTYAFSSTAAFRGIKHISEGPHLLTYGLDTSELGMRTGFFFIDKPGKVFAWRWDKETEQLWPIQEHVEGVALQQRIHT